MVISISASISTPASTLRLYKFMMLLLCSSLYWYVHVVRAFLGGNQHRTSVYVFGGNANCGTVCGPFFEIGMFLQKVVMILRCHCCMGCVR